jgi:hypothetical protein
MLTALALAVGAGVGPGSVSAQERTRTAVAAARYEVKAPVRFLAGSGWRDLWTLPVQVPVLDLGKFGGGLTPEREGGRQSYTLHFDAADGRPYIFRSVDKYLHKEALPDDLKHTPAGDVVQDQVSHLFPAAGLLVGPLYEAMGLLHPTPTLMVMPDDARLGEFRERFAGMLGQMEENPDEGPDETPGFAGSSRIVGADRMIERLDESSENRVHLPEYLAARLIQFMVGDTDRGSDQWRFARLDVNGEELFRPIARDHDFAFMKPNGVLGTVSKMAYPKLSGFDGTFESLPTLTFMTREMDRRMLAGLSRESWDSVVVAMQTRIDDDVLRSAVDRLPVEYREIAGEELLAGLQGRRDRLHEVAREFYGMIFHEVNVYATDEDEYAEVERLADGSVEIRLFAGPAPATLVASGQPMAGRAQSGAAELYFQRRFVPAETREIRLYLLGGDDVVRVTGAASRTIPVRVVGGAGDDVLVDSAQVAGRSATVFYTAEGDDRVMAVRGTRVDDRPFAEMLPGRPLDLMARVAPGERTDEDAAGEDEQGADEEGADEESQKDVADLLEGSSYRDWGVTTGTRPALDFRSRSGLLVGVGRSYTRYGFRREPYRYHLSGTALYAVDTGGFGLELFADHRFENSGLGVSLTATATQYESYRFFGFGNDTDGDVVASPRVTRDQVTVRPAMNWERGGTRIGVGPVFRWGEAKYDAASPMDLLQPPGVGSFAQAGALVDLQVERGSLQGAEPGGFSVNAAASAYPSLLDVTDPFGRVEAHARAYIPLPGAPFAALRAGGARIWGSAFPAHEAAMIGGRTTLRGFTTDRFAGDAAVYGSTELHVPLMTLELLVRGRLGVFGLADAGRVYLDGESPGGWHTSYGAGVWFTSLNRTLSLSYAEGERGRLYLRLGLPL